MGRNINSKVCIYRERTAFHYMADIEVEITQFNGTACLLISISNINVCYGYSAYIYFW